MQIPKRCKDCRTVLRMNKLRRTPSESSELKIIHHKLQSSRSWNQITPPPVLRSTNQESQPHQMVISKENALTPLSNSSDPSSVTVTPRRGRFWSRCSTDTENSTTPPVASVPGYWHHSDMALDDYDTPAQKEQLLSGHQPPTDNVSTPHNSDQTWFMLLPSDTWYNHIIAHQWHISARSSVSYGLYASVERHIMMDSPHNPLEFPLLNLPDIQMTHSQATGHSDRWADMSSDSESEGNLPSPQLSSSSDDLSGNVSSVHTAEPSNSPNIYSVIASLCTMFELLSICGVYDLYEEVQLMNRGPDLSPASLLDITLDQSLPTPGFTKYLKNSQVPHQTLDRCTRFRNSADFRHMQDIYSHLQMNGE